MKRIEYVGSMSDAVLESGLVVVKGKPVEVEDALAERYEGQPENFKIEPVVKPSKAKGGSR